MTRSRLGRVTERGFRGCRSQAAALLFFALTKFANLIGVDAADNGDIRHSQHVLHFCFLQPRSVVFKLKPIPLFIEAEFLEPVGIREKCQRPQLFLPQGNLQLISHAHECHAGIIAEETHSYA